MPKSFKNFDDRCVCVAVLLFAKIFFCFLFEKSYIALISNCR